MLMCRKAPSTISFIFAVSRLYNASLTNLCINKSNLTPDPVENGIKKKQLYFVARSKTRFQAIRREY